MYHNSAVFHFYRELNDFLPKSKRENAIFYSFSGNPSVKDAIEAIGIPHPEVDVIKINGVSVSFSHPLKNGDIVEVLPASCDAVGKEVIHLLQENKGEKRFVLDVHLGKLARLLRMVGFDTLYRNDYTDAEIVSIARKERRIILTRDIGLLKIGEVRSGYWIRSQHPKKQLHEVIEHFNLCSEIKPFHRCITCNGIINKVDKESIERCLEPKTRKYYNEFFKCTSCDKIYWKGSHYYRMKGIVENLMKSK